MDIDLELRKTYQKRSWGPLDGPQPVIRKCIGQLFRLAICWFEIPKPITDYF